MSREDTEHLGTADLVAGSERRDMHEPQRDRPAQPMDPRGTGGATDVRVIRTEPGQAVPDGQSPVQGQRMQGQPMQGQPMHGQPMQAPRMQDQPAQGHAMQGQPREELAALFPPEVAQEFRGRWDALQIGFVDDPRRTVQQADELVASVMKTLAGSFAQQRAALERGLGDGEQGGNTENLRLALRSYRSFFQRLLSL